MTIKAVLKMGDPRLWETARPVKHFSTPALDELIIDMQDTMRALDGAGLAAPQIGVGLRVIIFGFEDNLRYPDAESVPYTILINPEIEPLSDEVDEAWEGCLSLPGLNGLVPRFSRLRYTGFSPTGEKIDRSVDGFHARVVQHEFDHLDGILYPMRVKDLRDFGFGEALFSDEEGDEEE